MGKGPNRPAQRVVLPNGMWVLIYEDAEEIKIGGYDRTLVVTEVQSRGGSTAGGHVFVSCVPRVDTPRRTAERETDLITMPRARARVLGALGG